MIEVTFYNPGEIEDSLLKFAVIAARFEERWVFCRHRKRNTWEIPGGHREAGESVEETARRELWEETGAEEADIRPVSVYAVTRDGVTNYGMLYIAGITKMGPLPARFEIAQTLLTDKLPEDLTYPDIQPRLFAYLQWWRNLQNSPEELWDVYDENRNLTGRLHRRGSPLARGDYHMGVDVWMRNSRGEFLLTKRSANKGYPNLWESTGGSALAGEDSLTAALREVREETGLTLDPGKGRLLFTQRGEDYFEDVWLFRQDFDLSCVVLQPEETADKMYADRETILTMERCGDLVPYSYLPRLFELC